MENEKTKANISNYLNHLDREGLHQLIQFLILDPGAKESILMMAEEWNKMYPVLARSYTIADYEFEED